MRRQKSLRIGVHHADAVVWGPVYRTRLAADDVERRRREMLGEVDREPVAGDEARGERIPRGVVSRHRVSANGLERDVDAGVRSDGGFAEFREVTALSAREVEDAVALSDVRADDGALDLSAGGEG
eukprot:31369-Pelagococcus_subviridis.AAC.4